MADTIELSGILQDNDFVLRLTTVTNLGPALTRAEIEAVLTENSLPFPANSINFYIINTSRFFFVSYDANADRYIYILLSEAT